MLTANDIDKVMSEIQIASLDFCKALSNAAFTLDRKTFKPWPKDIYAKGF